VKLTARIITQKNEWNRFVSASPQGHLRQSFEWGEVRAADGWKPIRLAIEEGGEIHAGISILKKEIPFSGLSIFYAPRGPVLDYYNRELFDFLNIEVTKLANEHNAIFMRIDPDVMNDDELVRNYLYGKGFIDLKWEWSYWNTSRVEMRINLQCTEDEILKRMRTTARQNINILQKRGVIIKSDNDKNNLREFYELMVNFGRRKQLNVRAYNYYEKLWDEFIQNNLGKIFLAKYEGETIAGIFSIIFGNKSMYMHGASSGMHKYLNPNAALHWEMCKWARAKGCIWYDLQGTGTAYPPTPGGDGYSLYHFKKGLGSELFFLIGYFDMVFQPTKYKAFRMFEEKLVPIASKLYQKYNSLPFLKK
jgi:lipid II:glycine glycyltransferase (peptidoglycan interpeptide bridge formation enzyme)